MTAAVLSVALDATYSVGRDLTGVGVYSRELLRELAALKPETKWAWLYRPHRLGRAFQETAFQETPTDHVRRGVLLDRRWADGLQGGAGIFHGLNQRLPNRRFRRQVATFHDLFVMTAEYSTPEFRDRFTELARHAAAEADRVIAVSEFTAGQVVELLGVERERITVIPHGVRPFASVDAPREKIVLHVGAIQRRKNLVRLVRAFEELPDDWRLVLAGSNGFGSDEVFAEIARSRAVQRITATGYVSAGDLALWYARASIFAFPSLDEGFGIPVLEAMLAGVPVVASKTSAVGEIAGAAALGVDPMNQEELAANLRAFALDADLRSRYIALGRDHAAQYTWARAAEATFRIYEDLLTRR